MMVIELMQTRVTTFQYQIPTQQLWWYWFKHRQLEVNT
jgi:hypothetical protein